MSEIIIIMHSLRVSNQGLKKTPQIYLADYFYVSRQLAGTCGFVFEIQIMSWQKHSWKCRWFQTDPKAEKNNFLPQTYVPLKEVGLWLEVSFEKYGWVNFHHPLTGSLFLVN